MKRIGYLYDKIHSWDNLLLAYYRARKGKQGNAFEEYCYNWEFNLYRTQQELQAGTYQFGSYRQFLIHEPKERLITAAPFADRVVHHAIYNVIAPVLDKPLIVDSYACRTGKGLHRAVKKAFWWYKQSQYHYRLDISKYYYTVDHGILLKLITSKIKDRRVIKLIEKLLGTYETEREYYFHFEGDDLLDYIRPRGLPIGNLTSQLFANFYLSSLDHCVREELHLPGYIRYMDDIIIFSDAKERLISARDRIIGKLAELRLKVNERKNIIQSNNRGVDFLGFRLKGNTIRIRTQNLARFRRKLKLKSKDPECDLSKLLLSFNGHLGFLKAGHTKRIANAVLDSIEFRNQQKKWKLVI